MNYKIDFKGLSKGILISILNMIPIIITTIIRLVGLIILSLLIILHIVKNRNNFNNWFLTGETTIKPTSNKFMLWIKKIMEK